MPDDPGPIFTVMDAQCALCARGARIIARYDTNAVFRIVPLQSELGRALLAENHLDPDDPASWLFVEFGAAYTSLDAVTRVGWRLGGRWKVLVILRLLPPAIQNWLYRSVATRRYAWFGKADLCSLPDAEVQKRLVG